MAQELGMEELEELEKNLNQIINECSSTNDALITLPEVFGKEYQEEFLNLWLAYLLNPRINGFGVEPLNALLSCVNDSRIDEADDVTVTLEHTFTDNGRRIDLLIETQKLIIGIENKIYSGEQENQTRDYWNSMQMCKKTEQTVCGIYLKPDWNNSKPCEDFSVVTYTQLLNALRSISYDHSRNHRKNFFFYEFILYTEEKLMAANETGFPQIGKDALFYLKNRKELEEVKSSHDTYVNKLGNWLESQIKEKAPELIVDSPKSKYWQFRESDAWKELNFHYELYWEKTGKKSIAELTMDDENVFLCMHLESANDKVKRQFHEARKKSNNQKEIKVEFSDEKKALESINKIIAELRSEDFQKQAKIAQECVKLLEKQPE